MMGLNKETKDVIRKIYERFDEIYTLFTQQLSLDEKNYVLDFHNPGYSLTYCIRWGLKASEELLED